MGVIDLIVHVNDHMRVFVYVETIPGKSKILENGQQTTIVPGIFLTSIMSTLQRYHVHHVDIEHLNFCPKKPIHTNL